MRSVCRLRHHVLYIYGQNVPRDSCWCEARVSLLRRLLIFHSRGQDIRGTARDSRRGHNDKSRRRRRRCRRRRTTFVHERRFSRRQKECVSAVITIYNYLDAPALPLFRDVFSPRKGGTLRFKSRPTFRGNFRFGFN
jgi:hypothetical protein